MSGTPIAPEPHLPTAVDLPLRDETAAGVDLKTQLVRFVLTGALSAVVDFTITMLLQNGLGLPRAAAKSVGFVLGTTTAYLINRRWPFNAPPSRARVIAVGARYAVTVAVQVGL
ncbi:GtrA family protein, partial [Rhodococcus sp. NPDC058514]|uniref:GtrA family protein n=1 Tax=Rhodococcus sp. NPDC058514 TaxID=3346532 RepID=UPI00364C9374